MKLVLLAVVLACSPGRSTFARSPTAPTAFDREHADPKALAIADRVVAKAGGTHWSTTKQLKWSETITNDGKVALDFDEAWDRWNGRHYGRLRTDAGEAVVMRKLYEDDSGGAYIGHGDMLHALDAGSTTSALARARERWLFDTSMLCLAFLLEEPGATLAYVGEVPGEGDAVRDDIKVTFADKTRTGTWHAIVDRGTDQIVQIEVVKAGQPDTTRIGYAVSDWTDASGLQVPTKLRNLGQAGELITFKDIVAGEPDDTLYVPQVH